MTLRSMTEAATRGVLYKKVFLKLLQNSQENTCVSVSACNFIIKETLAHVFHRTPPGDCLCNKFLAACQFFYLVNIFVIQENVTLFIIFIGISKFLRKVSTFLETFRSSYDLLLFLRFCIIIQ